MEATYVWQKAIKKGRYIFLLMRFFGVSARKVKDHH
jgi:hypothetical protein